MVSPERTTIRPIPIGIDDFRKLREEGFEYIDKTNFRTASSSSYPRKKSRAVMLQPLELFPYPRATTECQ